MIGEHNYAVRVDWTGNSGTGTSSYRAYGRQHTITPLGPGAEDKAVIKGSSDPTFHGNAERWNPEELLLAALSQCHMLAYLHVAVRHGVTVVAYSDSAVGVLRQLPAGGGRFASATLRPLVRISDPTQIEFAQSLHAEAARECFIAASMNFPVGHEPVTTV